MKDTRTTAKTDRARQVRAKRRATRGLVAGYLHELSGRHGAARDGRITAEARDRPRLAV